MALGNRDGGRHDEIYSIELDDKLLPYARESLRKQGLLDRVRLIQGDSATEVGKLTVAFDLVFVDGDHTYDGVARDLEAVTPLLGGGSVVMCHDYFHPANQDGTYGVKRAVDAWSVTSGFGFAGSLGASLCTPGPSSRGRSALIHPPPPRRLIGLPSADKDPREDEATVSRLRLASAATVDPREALILQAVQPCVPGAEEETARRQAMTVAYTLPDLRASAFAPRGSKA